MPTTATHLLAGLGIGYCLAPGPMPFSYYLLTAALSVLPDIDAISFSLGIPYRSRFGHRGITHSICFALAAGLVAALCAALFLSVPWWFLWGCFFVVILAHAALDALTDGGMGVAFFSPFIDRRYFFPWQPIHVSPIGLAVFSQQGLRALGSEVLWVWIPLAACVGLFAVARRDTFL